MKKVLTLLLVVIALSSCSTKVDCAFNLYIQQEEARTMEDSATYSQKREFFKRAALLLDTDELGKLDRLIKEYKGDQAYMQREMDVKRCMINDILN